jgi:hypothetical protein
VKTKVLMDKGNKIQDDFRDIIPNLLWPGIMHMVSGISGFMDPF